MSLIKYLRLFIFLLPCTVSGQTDFKQVLGEARLEKIKWQKPFYLAVFDNPARSAFLNEHLLRKPGQFDYGDGLALMDQNGKIAWVYNPLRGSIVDMRMDKDTIYILNVHTKRMKMDSEIWLYEEKISKQGFKVSEKLLTSLKVYCGGSRINGMYSETGEIWTWTYWYNDTDVQIDSLPLHTVDDRVYYIQLFDAHRKNVGKHLISGHELELESFAVSRGFAEFIFNGVSSSLDDKYNSETSGTRALIIDREAKIKKMEIFGKNIFPTRLAVNGNQLIMAGYFQGNDSSNTPRYAHISGKSLSSPGFKSGEWVRNGFVAAFSTDLKLQWVQTLQSRHPMDITSLTVAGDTIAFGLEFRDEFLLDGKKLKSGNKRNYDYTDAAFCFLNTKGKLFSSELLHGNQYERPRIEFSPFHRIYYGTFTEKITLGGETLENDSNNSVNFMMMQKR